MQKEPQRILLTGATGQIGRAVVRFLLQEMTQNHMQLHLYLAGRDPYKMHQSIQEDGFGEAQLREEQCRMIQFSWERAVQDLQAPENPHFDIVFILRPPQIADVDRVFIPMLQELRKTPKLPHIVFLSVQGVEKSPMIPHHQIEKQIKNMGFTYTFVRPSYFMQNLTSTLAEDLQKDRKIYLPAHTTKFNWVDTENVAEVIARGIVEVAQKRTMGTQPDYQRSEAFDVTGRESLSFAEMVKIHNQIHPQEPWEYIPLNPLVFLWRGRRPHGISPAKPWSFLLVMLLLHWIPRFQATPPLVDSYQKRTGKAPTTLAEFFARRDAQK